MAPDVFQNLIWTPGPFLPIFTREDFELDATPAPVERSEIPLGLARIGISDIPRYDEIIDHVLDRLGWDRCIVTRDFVGAPRPRVMILCRLVIGLDDIDIR